MQARSSRGCIPARGFSWYQRLPQSRLSAWSSLPPKISRKRIGVQLRPRGVASQFVPGHGFSWVEDAAFHEVADFGVADVDHRVRVCPPVNLAGDGMVELRGEHL